ncbi:MAG TPA: 50S ribosomal protein L11 methyltransferase [Anaerolineales bacterium]|nr:50S ribosomal protein L11 methyltransferase [Anaerolineales bacterium]
MSQASWLEISLTVSGELAEPVAELLARFIPDGVVIESTAVVNPPDESEGHIVGPLRVFGYLPINDQLEGTRNQIEQGLWYLGRIQPLPAPQFRQIDQTNWSEAWKQHYRPIAIGKNLIIIPAWLDNPEPSRIAISIDPGMAFGTGTHPTTQLCLELIEAYLPQKSELDPGLDVIDIGCGSGILSIAALKLGARRALGVDIDADAIRASQENARTNLVSENFELGIGSLEDVLAGKFPMQKATLVLANILAPVIIKLFQEGLGELLTPNGTLILSGILEEQAEDVQTAFSLRGFRLVEKRQIGDWVALAVQKE